MMDVKSRESKRVITPKKYFGIEDKTHLPIKKIILDKENTLNGSPKTKSACKRVAEDSSATESSDDSDEDNFLLESLKKHKVRIELKSSVKSPLSVSYQVNEPDLPRSSKKKNDLKLVIKKVDKVNDSKPKVKERHTEGTPNSKRRDSKAPGEISQCINSFKASQSVENEIEAPKTPSTKDRRKRTVEESSLHNPITDTPRRQSFRSAVEKINLVTEFEESPPKSTKKKEPEVVASPRRSVRRTSFITTPIKENEVLQVDTPRRLSRRLSGKFVTVDRVQTKLEDIDEIERTPKSSKKSGRKSLRVENIGFSTPDKHIINELKHTPSTPLEKARHSLHVSSVPCSLPCREKEFTNIYNFVESKLIDEIGGCMYISGVPGTGKTATVCQVIKELQKTSGKNDVPKFQFFELNGLRLVDPKKAYSQLWKMISNTSTRTSVDQCQRNLEDWFSGNSKKKMSTVLLIDELDMMCTRKQDVVYNFLDWPTRTHSKLVVLAIANTMDMPERMLKGRVTSRLGLTRLTFYPYTYKQLEEIISTRLRGLDAFTSDAVQLVTRKVAAVSGDARRALDICRRATELPQPDETVNVGHIKRAIEEMCNSNIVKIIRGLSKMEKLFLQSISDECKRTGMEEVDYLPVIEHMLTLCTLEGYNRLPVEQISYICHRLRTQQIIYTSNSTHGLLQRLTLNVSQDDVYYALK